jgi:hypothetical protein
MGTFDLAVQLRCCVLDGGVADALIFEMPVKLSLELMAIIGSDLCDAKRELFGDAIDKVDRVGLCVFVVNLERPNTRRVANSGISESAGFLDRPPIEWSGLIVSA